MRRRPGTDRRSQCASAIGASELSKRKGYGEKWGLGTGLILSILGVIIWLIVPARPLSLWAQGYRLGRGPHGESRSKSTV